MSVRSSVSVRSPSMSFRSAVWLECPSTSVVAVDSDSDRARVPADGMFRASAAFESCGDRVRRTSEERDVRGVEQMKHWGRSSFRELRRWRHSQLDRMKLGELKFSTGLARERESETRGGHTFAVGTALAFLLRSRWCSSRTASSRLSPDRWNAAATANAPLTPAGCVGQHKTRTTRDESARHPRKMQW